MKNEILMIDPSHIGDYEKTLVRISQMQMPEGIVGADYWNDGAASMGLKPYKVEFGVMTIPVHGTLLGDFNITFYGMATGYDYIRAAFDRAQADSEVDEIVMEIKSSGGQVYGVMELVSYIRDNKKKPVTAMCLGQACSAAYAIACAADTIVALPSSTVGSIGALVVHQEYSEAMKAEGITTTIIRQGDRKAEGSPFEPLTAEAKKALDKQVKTVYDDFVLMVSRARNISVAVLDGLESSVVTGTEGLRIGLIDGLNSLRSETLDTRINMNHDTQAAALTAADLDKAKSEGMMAEQARLSALMSSDVCKKFPETALALACQTQLSAADIGSLLMKFEAEQATKVVKQPDANVAFAAAMATGNPEVGPMEPSEPVKETSASILAEVLNNVQAKKKGE